MVERTGRSMLDSSDLAARLTAAEARLGRHARSAPPSGLTEPDPDGTERWEAGQVWAHIAEFVPYWLRQLELVVGAYDGTPVPFGRTKADPARAAKIESARHESIAELMARVHDSIEQLRRYLAGLTSAEWRAVGRHSRLGDMDVRAIVLRFEVNHLEEHAEQLDSLR